MSVQSLRKPVAWGERYWLAELLAVGGMAEVYRGRQNAMAGFEKDIAIKRLKPTLASDPRFVAMFLHEARIGALFNHPHVAHTYDVGEAEGTPYIAMEYVAGEELSSLCRRGLEAGRFLPLPHAVEIVRQAALGLGHVHCKCDSAGTSLSIVHCDISPPNILVTADGFVKIIDFGIARVRDQRLGDASAVPGKLSYMSPEQAAGEPLDHRSDIFSLGIILYEITVGARLFRGPAQQVIGRLLAADIARPSELRAEFPAALEAIVLRALAHDRADRYGSAYDLARDLHGYLGEEGVATGPLAVARYLADLGPRTTRARRRLAGRKSAGRGRTEAAAAATPALMANGRPGTASAWDEFEESGAQLVAALGSRSAEAAPAAKDVAWGSRLTPGPVAAVRPRGGGAVARLGRPAGGRLSEWASLAWMSLGALVGALVATGLYLLLER